MSPMPQLLGAPEIALLLGVSRQRVYQVMAEDADFPEPSAVLSSGRVWEREAIEAWAKRVGREISG